jgi:diguanylate cyclase (GGDEF)-like protein/PAS domain S-box-containing protein
VGIALNPTYISPQYIWMQQDPKLQSALLRVGNVSLTQDHEADSRMLRTLISNLDGMVFRCRADVASSMEFVSDGCVALTGFQPEQLVADGTNPYGSLILADDRDRARDAAPGTPDAMPVAGHRYSIEYGIRRADGEERLVWERGTPVLDATGNIVAYEGFIEDITERRRYRQQIEQQASYDALTGLANRRLLNDRLSQAVARSGRTREAIAVAFIDLDNFKIINDSFGHEVGDKLIKEMAQRLSSCVRQTDTVARLGEFVLLLTRYGTAEDLAKTLQRVQSSVAQPWLHGKREFQVTSSCGVALFPGDGNTADSLLRNADAAMYRAKANGRNNLQFFTAELSQAMLARVGIEHRLRNAIARKQLELYYQPRVDVASGRLVAAEALLRWRLPRQGTVTPARFIEVAEETGLIVPIGRWALNTACQQAQAWRLQGLPPMVISVNVSPRQFRHDDIVNTIAMALKDSGLPAECLQIELTEGLAMHDAEHHIAMLHEIKTLGVQIAIDDFGTGYSSLSYLKRFPVDQLKVDRSFVSGLPGDEDDAAIVQAIVTLGHQLGLRVVAEGVETEAQNVLLRSIGCDEMQGYLFGRPKPVAEFEQFVERALNATGDFSLDCGMQAGTIAAL